MANTAVGLDNIGAAYVDMGTTNTRVWLVRGNRMLASVTAPIGIRDSARNGRGVIRKGVRELIAKAIQESELNGEPITPDFVAASGMIGSNLGLAEVPHIQAPAGIDELAAAARWHHFPDVNELPFLLVPGVRSGPPTATAASINEVDVMRGEETLCAGLAALELVNPPCTVLNLGSHWKAIQIRRDGKIASSVTSLSGELLHAAQLHTVLAGSLTKDRPGKLAPKWIQAGMEEQRRSGLARALFCARLLDLARQGSPDDRLAFAVGAFIAADLDVLMARGVIASESNIALVGHSSICDAWRAALSENNIGATIISQKQSETALLEALRRILAGALPLLESVSARARK